MPKVVIESASILDPLEVELDGKTYRAARRSPVLMERIRELREQSSTLEVAEYLVRVLGLVFGVSPDEFREHDVDVLTAVSEACSDYIGRRKNAPAAKPEDPSPGPADGLPASPSLPESSQESLATPTS